MKRKSLQGDPCPVARSLDLIGDWWSLLIIRDALAGTRRFSDFQKSLDVAKNILSVRLKGLVAQGVMEMVPAADGSIYKEYALTEKGRALQTVLIALSQWGNEFMYEPGELWLGHGRCQESQTDSETGAGCGRWPASGAA